MTAAYIVSSRVAPLYGAGRVCLDLALGLAERGLSVTVVTYEGSAAEHRAALPHSVEHHHIGTGKDNGLLRWLRLAYRLRPFLAANHGGNAAYIGILTHANFLLAVVSIIESATSRTIVTEHNVLSEVLRGKGWPRRLVTRTLLGVLYPRMASVVSVSQAIDADLSRSWRLRQSRRRVIYNPVDLKRLDLLAAEPIDMTKASSNQTYIACVAALKPAKGQSQLLRLMPLLPESVHLLLIGTGPDKEDLESLARQLEIGHRVHWLGELANPWPTVQMCDATILLSKYEGFGLAAAESAAIGVMPIGTAVGGLSEVLQAVRGHSLTATSIPELAAGVQAGLARASSWNNHEAREWLATLAPTSVAAHYLATIGFHDDGLKDATS